MSVAFISTVLATAKSASAQTGVLTSVILAQWADETGWGTSTAWTHGNNYAGVSYTGSITYFPNRATGLSHYVTVLNQSTYNGVRQASGWYNQALALGQSPWAAGHYGTPPGSALVTIIQSNNLTQYDGATASGGPPPGGTTNASTYVGTVIGTTPISAFHKAYAKIGAPPVGFGSNTSINEIVINGSTVSDIVGNCVVSVQLTLSITKASSVTLTIHDPTRQVLTHPALSQASRLTWGPYTWVLIGVDKAGSVLTCTFIPWVVHALQGATGPYTIKPGIMDRTTFAKLLVTQVTGATFTTPGYGYLYTLDQGYAHTNKEQLSRGTLNAPLENSWTALQRLANEIQWICFESFGTVYFGPYSWLVKQLPVLVPAEFTGGITTITGTYTSRQPLGNVEVHCVAGSWTPTVGSCVRLDNLGPFTGNWIVSEMTRADVEEPDITITLQQPLPGLPEPSTGGTNPAVGTGAGSGTQTTGGKTAAAHALAFALAQVGKGYSETLSLRLGPTDYDCSGLVYEAYLNSGVTIGTTTYSQWPTGAGTPVPAGIGNLKPGDLVFFGPRVGGTATHVAMVDTINVTAGTAHIVEAADPSQGVITDTFTPTIGAYYGTLVYLGAERPAP